MIWVLKKFKDLTIEEFHTILQLRINVFVVEQDCPYSELDGKDKTAFHLFAYAEDNPTQIAAYSRIFKPGDYFKEAAIGRVVVHPDYRKDKIGYQLMKESISQIEYMFPEKKIKIGAQTHLQKFYESLGFQKIGKDYIEDGIPHIHMLKS